MALVLIVAVVSVGCGSYDPAPPDFVIGASVDNEGALLLHLVTCFSNAPLQLVQLEQVGSDDKRTVLWKVVPDGGRGPNLDRGQSRVVTVGSEPPDGMRVVVPLAKPVPKSEKLGAIMNLTTRPDASVGFFFRVSEVEPGKIKTETGSLSPTDFNSLISETCHT